MKIACASDVHGKWSFKLPKADVLVLAGDCLPNFSMQCKKSDALLQGIWLEDHFIPMLQMLKYKGVYNHFVYVPGNHDRVFQMQEEKCRELFSRVENSNLLIDEGCIIEGKLFWGSPWTPYFHGDWWAFNFPDPQAKLDRSSFVAKACWESIPAETNVLVTHGPPRNVLDTVLSGESVGCPELATTVLERLPADKLKLHVFGHIHESAGRLQKNDTTFINAGICDITYKPNNPVQVYDYD